MITNHSRRSSRSSSGLHLVAAPLFATALLAGLVSGCDGDNPLCCNEADFQVGGTIEGDYDGEIKVALQAVADIGGIASASLDDLTTACRSIAEGLDVPVEQRDAENAKADKRERMQGMCALAAASIDDFKAKAGGSLSVQFEAPQCSANISAKASCQGSCSGEAKCDVKANPPQCSGSLEISCKGSCTAEANATVQCQGSCEGSCEGSCTAEGGVECAGKCEGTCKGEAEGGTGTGIKADGTCDGTCEGTCSVTPPGVTCTGSCNGKCDAACTAEAGGSVTCDGSCDGDFEPLKCEGGELSGGCEVDAKCEANCDASVKAKAECSPPSLAITVTGAADVQAAGKLKAVLEANLGLVASLQARFEGLLDITGTIVGNIDQDFLVDIKAACIPVVLAAVATAGEDVIITAEASASVMGKVVAN